MKALKLSKAWSYPLSIGFASHHLVWSATKPDIPQLQPIQWEEGIASGKVIRSYRRDTVRGGAMEGSANHRDRVNRKIRVEKSITGGKQNFHLLSGGESGRGDAMMGCGKRHEGGGS